MTAKHFAAPIDAVHTAVDAVLEQLDSAVPAGEDPARYVSAIPAHQLFADPAYQRQLDETRVEQMAAHFNPALLGVLAVSARGDDRFAVIEGQHRWAAAQRASGVADVPLVCLVHTGLTVRDEADLFHRIDTQRRSLTSWDRWKARGTAGDPVVAAVDAVVAAAGLRIDPAPRDGALAATGALERIHRLGGRDLLAATLLVLTRAYRDRRDGYDGSILHAVALVLHGYDLAVELNVDRLIDALGATPPADLLARARQLRRTQNGALPRLIAALIIEAYDRRPGRSLPPLERRAGHAPTRRFSQSIAVNVGRC